MPNQNQGNQDNEQNTSERPPQRPQPDPELSDYIQKDDKSKIVKR